MMTNAYSARDPKWADENKTAITLIWAHPVFGEIEFTASASDPEAHGRELYATAAAGDFGPVAEYVAPPALPPFAQESVTPWQIRKALNQLGLRNAVETAVAASDDHDLKDGWQYATEVRRDDPLIAKLAAALGKTDAEIDALFALAATL